MEKSKKPIKEIEALYEMLMTPYFRSVVWSKSGRCIVIKYPGLFISLTGPFFGFDKGVKEFTKFLVSHGFRKVPKSRYLKYHNKFFQKNRRDLLCLIQYTGPMGCEDEEAIPQQEIDQMREGCRNMMQEIKSMKSKYEKNENMISMLSSTVFLLSSYMKPLRSYFSAEASEYNASNSLELGPGMAEWEKRHLKENRRATFGFLNELEEVVHIQQKGKRKAKSKRKRDKIEKKSKNDRSKKIDIEIVAKMSGSKAFENDFQ